MQEYRNIGLKNIASRYSSHLLVFTLKAVLWEVALVMILNSKLFNTINILTLLPKNGNNEHVTMKMVAMKIMINS